MKVKVVKASKQTYWYGNNIGEVFEVREKPTKSPISDIPRYLLKETPELAFDVDDVKIIIEEFVFR